MATSAYSGLSGTQSKIQNSVFGNISMQQLGYVFQGGDTLDLVRYAAYRADVAGFDGHLYLFIKGLESQTKQIDEFWQQLMVSLSAGKLTI